MFLMFPVSLKCTSQLSFVFVLFRFSIGSLDMKTNQNTGGTCAKQPTIIETKNSPVLHVVLWFTSHTFILQCTNQCSDSSYQNVVMCYLTLKVRTKTKRCHAASHPTASHRNLFPSLFFLSAVSSTTPYFYVCYYCFYLSFGIWNVIWKQQFELTLCAILCSTFTRLRYLSLSFTFYLPLSVSFSFCRFVYICLTKQVNFEPAKRKLFPGFPKS